MTILPMSIWEKLQWFVIWPIYEKLFPKSLEELKKEKQDIQKAKQRLEEMGFHFYDSPCNGDAPNE